MLTYEYNVEELTKSISQVHFCDIIEFNKKLMTNLYAKIFFTGNLTRNNALNWGKLIYSSLQYQK